MTDDFNDDSEYKSKTRLKKEMHALQDLGAQLLELPAAAYKKMPIPEELDEAISAMRKIKSHPARRRQMQYIGKVMREIDAAPIQKAYDDWKNGNKQIAREFQQLEQLRDDLLAAKPGVLESLIEECPDCDIQQLRQLVRLAQQERNLQKPPKHFRKLFQLLKELKSTGD